MTEYPGACMLLHSPQAFPGRERHRKIGGLAQLAERKAGSLEVTGSTPVSSTNQELHKVRQRPQGLGGFVLEGNTIPLLPRPKSLHPEQATAVRPLSLCFPNVVWASRRGRCAAWRRIFVCDVARSAHLQPGNAGRHLKCNAGSVVHYPYFTFPNSGFLMATNPLLSIFLRGSLSPSAL